MNYISKSFMIPKSWWLILSEAAKDQDVSVSHLFRRVVRMGAVEAGIKLPARDRKND